MPLTKLGEGIEINTGTTEGANAVILTAQTQLGRTTGNNDCARFVSDTFKAAGFGSFFKWTSWVPDLVAEFTRKGSVSKDLSTARPGDLIVFGDSEHVMIYEGSGQVIGTSTGKDGVTRVIETSVNNIITDNHKDVNNVPKIVLHTGLDNPDTTPTINETGMFALAMKVLLDGYKGKTYQDLVNANPQPFLASMDWTIDWTKVLHYAGLDPSKTVNPDTDFSAFLSGLTLVYPHESQTTTIGGQVQDNPIQSIANSIGAAVGFLGKFTNPANWVHVGAILAGIGLIGFGLWMASKELSQPEDTSSPVPTPDTLPVFIKE